LWIHSLSTAPASQPMNQPSHVSCGEQEGKFVGQSLVETLEVTCDVVR
jgi:hypothetical protein